jgi:hypothetical protein
MNTIQPSIILAILLASGLHTAAQAHGDFTCKVPVAEWQYKEALEDKLKKEGWDVRRIKIDKGCYEVYGFDGKGARKEAYFNPKTFEFVGEVPQQ